MRKQNFERTMRHLFLRTVILLELLLEPLDGFLQMLTMYHSTPSPRTALTASMHHPLLSHANQCLPLKYHWRQLLPRLRRRESIVCFLALPSGSGRAVDMLGGNAADALNASTAAGEDYDTPCESQDSTDGAQTEFLAPHEGLDTTSEASDARNAAQKKSNAFTPYGERETVEELSSVCRIVAEGDGKLAVESLSPSFANSPMLDRINAIFQASILSKTSHLHVNPTISSISREIDHAARRGINAKIELEVDIAIDSCFSDDAVEERQLPTVMRNSLESAGFVLLKRRDVDLCEALNAGYLLRLSIVPDTRMLDPHIFRDFYPEAAAQGQEGLEREMLFDGRLLLYRRGYSAEVSRGRLLLPKIDYLQATLVQRAVAPVTELIRRSDRLFAVTLAKADRWLYVGLAKAETSFRKGLRSSVAEIEARFSPNFASTLQNALNITEEVHLVESNSGLKRRRRREKILELAPALDARYGNSGALFSGRLEIDAALAPFEACQYSDTDKSGVPSPESLLRPARVGKDSGAISCEYDEYFPIKSSSQLLRRVSISNVVDVFSKRGRLRLFRSFVSVSELVEPTFEELVVVWRPEICRPKKSFAMPEQLRPLAKWLQLNERSLFQARGKDSQTAQRSLKRLPLKVRVFSAVPMANLPAVLPKTRLVFRPADALTFDLVSVFSLLAVLLTQRVDDDRYNLLAIVSVSVWLLRTVIRYSNKLMQYDLLLKKFLTSKITQRGTGALGYLSSEGGSQRARRAGLVHAWLLDCHREQDGLFEKDWILQEGQKAVNTYIQGDILANIDMQAALQDLEDLGLILGEAEGKLRVVNGGSEAMDALKRKWVDLFDRS